MGTTETETETETATAAEAGDSDSGSTGGGPDARRRAGVPWSGRRNLDHPALKAMHDDRTLGERVADNVAHFGGSWPFIFTFLGLIFAWMVPNTVFLARVLDHKQFDPYPYIALNLMLSALAGLQAPIIMMSQNRAAARDEALAAHHYSESRRTESLAATHKKVLEANTEVTERVHDLLEANTDLTRQVHDLAERIQQLVEGNGTGKGREDRPQTDPPAPDR
ncbi:MAG: DUF1003 domain-containing protein [Actinomycetota bacterium]|nr:DUF1003 domain-containing protein [Actinomycetota bacterium]